MLTVAGIDLAAGRGTTEVAVLRLAAGAERPCFEATAHRSVTSDGEILAALLAACPTVVAIDAPLSLPAVVAAAVRGEPVAVASGDAVEGMAASPYTRAAERDPLWGRLGVRPLPVSFLGGLTFRALALLPQLRAHLPAARLIEVFPSATLRAFGIRPAERGGAAGRRTPKTAPAARSETQRGLAALLDGLPPAQPEPLGADLLDALAAALTALAYARDAYIAAGDPQEGQIIVPQWPLAGQPAAE